MRLSIYAVAAMLPALVVSGQDRISDVFHVTLRSEAQVGDTSLQPGEYKIRQLPTASSPRMLEFIDKDGKAVRTTISAIPALKNNGADATVLQFKQTQGGTRYVSHLWVEGKSYGYELPEPSGSTSSANRQTSAAPDTTLRMEGAARWVEPPAPTATASAAPAPTPTPEPAPTPTPEPVQQEAPQAQPQQTQPQQAEPEPRPSPVAARLPETGDRTVAVSVIAGMMFLSIAVFVRPRRRQRQ